MKNTKNGKMLMALLLCLVLALCCAACGSGTESTAGSTGTASAAGTTETVPSSSETDTEQETADATGLDENELPIMTDGGELPAAGEHELHHVQIQIRDYGTVNLVLDATEAPLTVQNFLDLAGSGFYDGLTFHRIMDGFMIQGGDPLGTGSGGSGATIKGEFSANGWENSISHVPGVISMARSQNMDSASSQFFICVGDASFLDGQYAAFGWTADEESLQIVCQIAADARPVDNNGTIPAAQQPVIESVTVVD